MKHTKTLNKIYTALIFIFLYAPIAVLILFSFNNSNSTGVFTGFSLKWYRELLSDSATLTALKNTLILAVTSSAIATVIGTAAAVGIEKMRNRHLKNTVKTISNLPMMNPDIVTGIAMALLFAFAMKLDLGCTPMQSFFKVELPSILPGVLSGLVMSFTLSLDDFVISYFNTDGDFQTLPIYIFGMTKRTVTPDIYSLSTLLFVSVLLLLFLSNLLQSHSEKKELMKLRAQKKTRRGARK